MRAPKGQIAVRNPKGLWFYIHEATAVEVGLKTGAAATDAQMAQIREIELLRPRRNAGNP